MRGQHAPWWALCLAVALGGILAPIGVTSAASDTPSKSAALAKELAQQLDQAKLDHIAARDPEDPSRFIGAMYFPGVELVTVALSLIHISEPTRPY